MIRFAPPSLTRHIITEYTNAANGIESSDVSLKDFGSYLSAGGSLTTDNIRIRIRNAEIHPIIGEVCAIVQNPICYIGGADVEIVARTNQWVNIMNVSNNGVAVADQFTPVRASNFTGYKALASNIEPGTYIAFDTNLVVPAQTPSGHYSFEYIIEYQYTT